MQNASTLAARSPTSSRPRPLSGYLGIVLKGIGMGMADVVPGVSGGTIAFITGIYPELLEAIRALGTEMPRHVLAGRFREAWRAIHGDFLVALGLGIALAIVVLSRVVLFALRSYPEAVWAFFFGLVLGAAVVIGDALRHRVGGSLLWAIPGALIGYVAVTAVPMETPESLGFVALSGAVAISAMVLPGISGSFVLVVLGKYEFVLGALRNVDVDVIAAFVGGCAAGILAFAQILSWLFRRFYDATMALIVGFLLGSLPKIWPWKHTLEVFVDRHGQTKPLIQESVWPWHYGELTGQDPGLGVALLLAIVGLALVVTVERGTRSARDRSSRSQLQDSLEAGIVTGKHRA